MGGQCQTSSIVGTFGMVPVAWLVLEDSFLGCFGFLLGDCRIARAVDTQRREREILG